MLEYLPAEIREGLQRAQRRQTTSRRRLALHLGDQVFQIHRFWDDGFTVDAENLAHLRGRVAIYEGPRQILNCLIVASEIEDGQLVCHFKSTAPVHDSAPVDYELDAPRATIFLSQH